MDGLETAVYKLTSGNYVEACRQKAKREFDNIKCFNPYILLYNRLIGGGKIANKPTGNPSSTLGGVGLSRHFYYGAKR